MLPLVKLLRPRQWVKNVFVVVPLFFGFKFGDPYSVAAMALAFVTFCCVSSAIYVFNDLRDIEADRQHPKKRFRPLAAGTVSIPVAYVSIAALALCAAACIMVARLPPSFIFITATYAGMSLSYSLGLKNVPLLELFVVASGYVLRVIAGCHAIDVLPSPWILGAAGSVALLIVSGKRRAEMAENLDPDANRRSLAGYTPSYLDSVISVLGAVTIMQYLMFVSSDYAIKRYGSEAVMLTVVFVAYGVLRYIQLIKVGQGADSPTDLVTRDPGLIGAVLLWVATFLFLFLYYR